VVFYPDPGDMLYLPPMTNEEEKAWEGQAYNIVTNKINKTAQRFARFDTVVS